MSKDKKDLLREKIQGFIRAFGLLRNQTPCGKPISVSMAHALMHLRSSADPWQISQRQLQMVLCLDKSNITRLCAALERDGFAEQGSSPGDGRVRIVTLTKKGERLADSLLAASQRRFSSILARVPKARHEEVFRALDLLTEAIHTANLSGEESTR